jgi:hypothetical protein
VLSRRNRRLRVAIKVVQEGVLNMVEPHELQNSWKRLHMQIDERDCRMLVTGNIAY